MVCHWDHQSSVVCKSSESLRPCFRLILITLTRCLTENSWILQLLRVIFQGIPLAIPTSGVCLRHPSRYSNIKSLSSLLPVPLMVYSLCLSHWCWCITLILNERDIWILFFTCWYFELFPKLDFSEYSFLDIVPVVRSAQCQQNGNILQGHSCLVDIFDLA